MALHGSILMNGKVLGVWEARRLITNTDTGINRYVCEVDMFSHPLVKGEVDHLYTDSAAVLAAKVLSLVQR